MSSLFLTSRAMFRRAVATAHTTRSLSILSNSTRMGSPFSFRTAARMYTDHYRHRKRTKKVPQNDYQYINWKDAFKWDLCQLCIMSHHCLFSLFCNKWAENEEKQKIWVTVYTFKTLRENSALFLRCIHLKISYTVCELSKETLFLIKFTMFSNSMTLRYECVFVSVIMVVCVPETVWLVRGSSGAGLLTGFKVGPTFQLPAARFCRAPAAPSSVSGFEHSDSRVRYGFTMDGCHSICSPFGGSLESGKGPTPSHWKQRHKCHYTRQNICKWYHWERHHVQKPSTNKVQNRAWTKKEWCSTSRKYWSSPVI